LFDAIGYTESAGEEALMQNSCFHAFTTIVIYHVKDLGEINKDDVQGLVLLSLLLLYMTSSEDQWHVISTTARAEPALAFRQNLAR